MRDEMMIKLVRNSKPFASEGEVGDVILKVTTQVPKPLSGDFTMQELSGTWGILQPTGNLTAEYAERRREEISG